MLRLDVLFHKTVVLQILEDSAGDMTDVSEVSRVDAQGFADLDVCKPSVGVSAQEGNTADLILE